jgi:uncharacterized protein (TIGR02452 family)
MDRAGYETDRITVWNQTKERYKDFPEWPSVKYTEMPPPPQAKRYTSTTIILRKVDMISKAVVMKLAGSNPLVLNMADWFHAGGCVDAGSGAQEEECFRRSNYFKTLLQSYYPLGKLDTIVSKDVEYYRDGLGYYTFMPTPVKLDMIAQPALQYPWITRDAKFFAKEADIELFEQKIHMLLRVAALQGNETLILSAWGCGAFGCPPYHVAKMFKKILAEYDGVFNEVVFAILGQNYELFKKSWDETE